MGKKIEEKIDMREHEEYADVIIDGIQQAGITKPIVIGFYGEGIAILGDIEISQEKLVNIVSIVASYLGVDLQGDEE